MKSGRKLPRIGQVLVSGSLLGCLLAGCAVVGPAAVRSGRLAYNEAIIETDNQQLLLAVVRNRYAERSNLLAVASVTANVSVTSSANIEIGAGDKQNYSGNLVPFRAGVVYEENPTISYMPVGGEKYASQLMSPLSLQVFAQLAGTRRADSAGIYYTLVSSVNGIYNPDFLVPPAEPDTRFIRFATLMAELSRVHRLHWVRDQEHDRLSIVIDHYTPDYTAEVRELLELLGLRAPKTGTAQIVLPVSLALTGREYGGVAIITRSVVDLLEILTAAVEVTEQEQRDGVSLNYPPAGLAGRSLHIHRATAEPAAASVAVRYRDAWFYIDDRDAATKLFFRLLGSLYSVAISEGSAKQSGAPLLMVPVSR